MINISDFTSAWADKNNREAAYAIAEQYVAENSVMLEQMFGNKTSDELVQLVSLSRLAGNHEMAQMITIWELVKFPRKEIGGAILQFNPLKGKSNG